MKIYIGSDHAGFELKTKLIDYLRMQGHVLEDKGPALYDAGDDYPDFIIPVAVAVSHDQASRGIVIGGSGTGEAMCANRTKDVRAALYYGGPLEIVRLSREHNNANVLSLGARFMSDQEALEAVDMWLSIPFSGDERHARRLAKF